MNTFRPRHVVRRFVLWAVASIVLGVSAVVLAQSSAPAPAAGNSVPVKMTADEHAFTRHMEQMIRRLKLTEDQKTRVKPIMMNEMAQARELHTRYTGKLGTPEGREAMEKEHHTLMADTEAKLAQVLTPEQMTQLKSLHGDRHEHMKKREAMEDKQAGQK